MIPGLERSSGEGIGYPLQYFWASLVAQLVENLSAMWETWVFLLHMKTFYKLVVLLLQNHLLLMYVYVCVCADVCVCARARARILKSSIHVFLFPSLLLEKFQPSRGIRCIFFGCDFVLLIHECFQL